VEVVRTFGEPVLVDRVLCRGVRRGEHVLELGPTPLAEGTVLRLPLRP